MVKAAKKQDSTVTDRAIGNSLNAENQQVATLPKKILSLDEACSYLGIAKGTMYKYLGDGSIKGFKYKGSRVWKFDIEYLDQWLRQQQEGSNG